MAERQVTERQSKGLKAGAVGFWDGVSIGVDSTAPAYTIAAVLGSIALIAGTKAPAVLIVSFIPMLFIAGAFYYMNRADPDCGTTFSWVTRAMGPWMGWIGGWAIFSTGVLVIGAQADVAAKYFFVLVGLDDLAQNRVVVVIFKAFLVIGLAPVVGAIVLFVLLVAAMFEYADPEASYTETAVFGVGAPLAMAVLIFVTGLVLMVVSRFTFAQEYFTKAGGEQVEDEVALAALGPAGPGI